MKSNKIGLNCFMVFIVIRFYIKDEDNKNIVHNVAVCLSLLAMVFVYLSTFFKRI